MFYIGFLASRIIPDPKILIPDFKLDRDFLDQDFYQKYYQEETAIYISHSRRSRDSANGSHLVNMNGSHQQLQQHHQHPNNNTQNESTLAEMTNAKRRRVEDRWDFWTNYVLDLDLLY